MDVNKPKTVQTATYNYIRREAQNNVLPSEAFLSQDMDKNLDRESESKSTTMLEAYVSSKDADQIIAKLESSFGTDEAEKRIGKMLEFSRSLDQSFAESYFKAFLTSGNADVLSDDRVFGDRVSRFANSLNERLFEKYFTVISKTKSGIELTKDNVIELISSMSNMQIEKYLSTVEATDRVDTLTDDRVLKFMDSIKDCVEYYLSAIDATKSVDTLTSERVMEFAGGMLSSHVKYYFSAIGVNPEYIDTLTSERVMEFAKRLGRNQDYCYFAVMADTNEAGILTSDMVINDRVLELADKLRDNHIEYYFSAIANAREVRVLTSDRILDFGKKLSGAQADAYFSTIAENSDAESLTSDKIVNDRIVHFLIGLDAVADTYFPAIAKTEKIDILTSDRILDFAKRIGPIKANHYFSAIAETNRIEMLTSDRMMDLVSAFPERDVTIFCNELRYASHIDEVLTYAMSAGIGLDIPIKGIDRLIEKMDERQVQSIYSGFFTELEGSQKRRAINSFNMLATYFPVRFLQEDDVRYIVDHKKEFTELSELKPIGFVPIKIVLKEYVEGNEEKRIELKRKVLRMIPFDKNDLLDVAIEYGKMLPQMIQMRINEDWFEYTFENFRKAIGRAALGSNLSERDADESKYAAYEILKLGKLMDRVLKASGGKANVIGNLRIGAVYSEALKELYKNKNSSGITFALSRVGSSEMHSVDYILRKELLREKRILADTISGIKPLFIIDASTNGGMPDAFKAFRSYFAALEMIRIGRKECDSALALDDLCDQTNIPVHLLKRIRNDLFAPEGEFYNLMERWFALGKGRVKPFKIFEYNMSESLINIRYRIGGGLPSYKNIENSMPTADDMKKYNCVVLVQPSLQNSQLPVKLRDIIGVKRFSHELAYFDDKDESLQPRFYYDEKGVHIKPSIVSDIAKDVQKMDGHWAIVL